MMQTLIACVLAAGVGTCDDDKSLDVSAVVRDARLAIGFEKMNAFTGLVRREGVAHHHGVDGPCTILSASDGRFVRRIDGPLGWITGFDGTTRWIVDKSGMPRILELQDREDQEISWAVMSGRWLAADGMFTHALDEKQTDPNTVALTLRLKNAVLDSTLRLDRTSWLPVSLSRRSSSGDESWTFADWRRELGFALPGRVTFTSGVSTVDVEIRSTRREDPGAGDPFARITKRPADARFDPAVPARLEVKRAKTGHFLVHPLVEGKDQGWFILDTGAGGMVITGKAAADAGLPALGETVAFGVGGPVRSVLRQGKRFTLGPFTIEGPIFIELDLDFLSAIFGVPVAGVAGYDLFARAVVDLDVEAGTVDLHDPNGFSLHGGAWTDLMLDRQIPSVRGRFEGDREGLFRLDTGSATFLIFHSPAVRQLALLDGRETSLSASGGVGGMNLARAGKIAWFELAGQRFDNPNVEFSLGETGALADPYALGNLGCGVLSSFRVVFDYAHKRIAFVRKLAADSK